MADYNKNVQFSNWEKTYWKFRVVQFERRLHDNSGDALVLPKTFVENVSQKLGKNVTLKTPVGCEWRVGLETDKNGNVFLKEGWKDFVKSHYLKKNDSLTFKYYGDSKFDVTMFDGETSIEKASAHFVEKALDPVTEIRHNDKYHSATKHRAVYNRRAASYDDHDDDDSDPELLLTRNKKSRKLQYRGCDDNGQENRRSSTNLQKKQRTSDGTNDDDVLEVYMQPSYVNPACFVCMSKSWAQDHNIVKSQEMLLHKDGKTWEIMFYIRKRICGIDKAGWKAFVDDNRVKKGDLCFFSVIPGSRDPIILDVRVVHAKDGVEREKEEQSDPVSPF